MARVHLSIAVAAVLVLAGCIGGSGGTAPGTAVETTGETTETVGAESTTEQTSQTTEGEPLETTAGTENATLSGKDIFEAYGVGVNYSAGGDLDASSVVRSHLAALESTERLTASSVSRSETGEGSTVASTYLEREGDRSLFRTSRVGMNVTIYHGEDVSVMKTGRDGEASYLALGDGSDSDATNDASTDPEAAVVMELAKLQLMPYEEAGTVMRNGTTMTKYEATGPGYYASDELEGDASVESYSSTVLVDEDGLVRLFRQKVVVEQGGETVTEEVTVRYENVGTATVTEPGWVEEARNATAETDGGDGDDGDDGNDDE